MASNINGILVCMNILFSYRNEEEKRIALELLLEHNVQFVEGNLHEAKWDGKGIDCISIFVNTKVDQTILNQLPDLKLITTRSTGYDHIDLPLLKEKNIALATVPGYGEHSVAEFTFSLLLALSRKLYGGITRVKGGSFYPEGLMGTDLYGKTIGIIGTGAIGKSVIRIAKGFGMNVIAYDVFPDKEKEELLQFSYVPLADVFRMSDVITLHAPENTDTHHMISTEAFASMKKGVLLVNTSRGGLIDTKALLEALLNDVVGGVALDVLEGEEYMRDEMKLMVSRYPNEEALKMTVMNHALLESDRVLITPHMAFNTKEAMLTILKVTAENIEAFARKETKNIVS